MLASGSYNLWFTGLEFHDRIASLLKTWPCDFSHWLHLTSQPIKLFSWSMRKSRDWFVYYILGRCRWFAWPCISRLLPYISTSLPLLKLFKYYTTHYVKKGKPACQINLKKIGETQRNSCLLLIYVSVTTPWNKSSLEQK